MGLCAIPASDWIKYEDDYSERITQKKDLIANQRDRVIQSIEGSEAAQYELLDNILTFIDSYKTDLFTLNNNSIISHKDNRTYDISEFESKPLDLISYLASEDYCLLDRFNDDYRLAAASVCTPTYWELSEKMGKPMKDVHAPIANLEEKIGRMIKHFFVNLKPDNYYQRSNWFLMTTPDLTLFKDTYDATGNAHSLDADDIIDKLYLRCERQSFRKLTKTEYIAFGIKIYVSPLSIVSKHTEIAEDMILAIDSMTEDHKQLIGINLYENKLLDYLKSVSSNDRY
jgi:hypothetical protein